MKEKIYIHYGHEFFDEKLFVEIRNREFVKPTGGLWASNIKALYGWKDWCKDENFRECKEDNSFKFKLKDSSKVLVIDNAKKLEKLPKLKLPFPIEFTFKILDFEEIKKDYDAMEVLISNDIQLYWDLYGWDCDSLLVFNKECIEVIK